MSELPIHTLRPRKDPRRWLMQIADNHPVFYRDLPADVRAWGIQRLMQMVRRGDFPAYRQIVHGGKRFWAGRDIKAWLAGQRTPTSAGPDNHVAQDGGEVSS